MNLETMGGPIYRTRSDSMPQTEPRPGRPRKPAAEPQPQPRQPEAQQRPKQPEAQQQLKQPQPQARSAEPEQRAEPRARRNDSPRPIAAKTKSVSLAAQSAKAAKHVAEHGNYLAAHAVEKTFGTRKVVKGASLYVRRGEAVGLLGPNGAGKTTIFYMITGLIKADIGRIELDGYDVTSLPMYQRARLGIGYLPQEASIFRGLNVEDNVRAVLEVAVPERQQREDTL